VGATIDGVAVTSAMPTIPVVSLSFSGEAIAVGTNHACEIRSGGAVWCWGSNAGGQLGDGTTTSAVMPVAVSAGLSFVAITAGYDHSAP